MLKRLQEIQSATPSASGGQQPPQIVSASSQQAYAPPMQPPPPPPVNAPQRPVMLTNQVHSPQSYNMPPQPYNPPQQPYNPPQQPYNPPQQPYNLPPQQQYNMPQQQPMTSTGQSTSQPIESDQYKKMLQVLAMYNILVIMDDSGSMEGGGINKGVSRWSEALEAIDLVLKYGTEFDTDGCDIYFLNAPYQFNIQRNDKILDKIRENKIFPRGGTPLGSKLNSVFNDFKDLYSHNKRNNSLNKVKPINVIVITDGEPSDKDALLQSIVSICQFFEDQQANVTEWVGVQFFQVGDDKNATEYLRMLDDDIKDKCRLRSGKPVPDIVDSTCYNPADPLPLKFIITKVLLGGINASMDTDKSHEVQAKSQGSAWGSFWN